MQRPTKTEVTSNTEPQHPPKKTGDSNDKSTIVEEKKNYQSPQGINKSQREIGVQRHRRSLSWSEGHSPKVVQTTSTVIREGQPTSPVRDSKQPLEPVPDHDEMGATNTNSKGHREKTVSSATKTQQEPGNGTTAVIPMVRVRLVTSLRVPPYQSIRAQVETDDDCAKPGPLLLQYRQDVEESLGICADDVVIDPVKDEVCVVLLSNSTGFTRHMEAGEYLVGAVSATVVDLQRSLPSPLMWRKRGKGK